MARPRKPRLIHLNIHVVYWLYAARARLVTRDNLLRRNFRLALW